MTQELTLAEVDGLEVRAKEKLFDAATFLAPHFGTNARDIARKFNEHSHVFMTDDSFSSWRPEAIFFVDYRQAENDEVMSHEVAHWLHYQVNPKALYEDGEGASFVGGEIVAFNSSLLYAFREFGDVIKLAIKDTPEQAEYIEAYQTALDLFKFYGGSKISTLARMPIENVAEEARRLINLN